MNEIEVILDVRQVPDTLDLLVVRQKVGAEGGELRLVGAPSESRISLSSRKAKVTLSRAPQLDGEVVLLAHVQNVGLSCLDRVKVSFDYAAPQPREAGSRNGPSTQEAPQRLDFIQANRKPAGPILSGETRDYYLPDYLVEVAARAARSLAPDQYGVVARSGKDELGRVPGAEVATVLQPENGAQRVQMGRLVRTLLGTLPAKEQQAAKAVLDSLNEDPSHWKGAVQLPGNKEVYLLPISPELLFVVRQPGGSNVVEVMDVLPSDVLRGALGNHLADTQG